MNEREALLRAICENPDDDNARLVFADWLQEHGEEERAEFIRVQILLARGNYRPSAEAKLKRRARELQAHTDRWNAEVPEAEQVQFIRGFVERASFASGVAFEQSFRTAPLRWVTIRGPVDLLSVMRLPGIGHVARLELAGAVVEVDLVTLADGEWPERPQELLISPSWVPASLQERVIKRHSWVWFPTWL